MSMNRGQPHDRSTNGASGPFYPPLPSVTSTDDPFASSADSNRVETDFDYGSLSGLSYSRWGADSHDSGLSASMDAPIEPLHVPFVPTVPSNIVPTSTATPTHATTRSRSEQIAWKRNQLQQQRDQLKSQMLQQQRELKLLDLLQQQEEMQADSAAAYSTLQALNHIGIFDERRPAQSKPPPMYKEPEKKDVATSMTPSRVGLVKPVAVNVNRFPVPSSTTTSQINKEVTEYHDLIDRMRNGSISGSPSSEEAFIPGDVVPGAISALSSATSTPPLQMRKLSSDVDPLATTTDSEASNSNQSPSFASLARKSAKLPQTKKTPPLPYSSKFSHKKKSKDEKLNPLAYDEDGSYKQKVALHKTELCGNWLHNPNHYCGYGKKCHYAHGYDELQDRIRIDSFKCQPCPEPAILGKCMFGVRCNYAHPGDSIRRSGAATVLKRRRNVASSNEEYYDKQYFEKLQKDFPGNKSPFGVCM